jgi:hypothetical protein
MDKLEGYCLALARQRHADRFAAFDDAVGLAVQRLMIDLQPFYCQCYREALGPEEPEVSQPKLELVERSVS